MKILYEDKVIEITIGYKYLYILYKRDSIKCRYKKDNNFNKNTKWLDNWNDSCTYLDKFVNDIIPNNRETV